MTGLDLISGAFRLLNVLASGETLPSADANDALEVAQLMLDGWQAERLMIFSIVRQTLDVNNNPFTFTPGKQSYTVGTGGDFNIPRPARIENVGLINLSNPAQPLELPLEMLNIQQWEAIPVKSIQATIPLKVFNDLGFPLMTLSYWAVPTVANQTALYIWSLLSTFPDLTTDVTFPPAYLRAIKYNLAVDLAPEFGVGQINPVVLRTALDAKAVIKRFNIPTPLLGCDRAIAARPGKSIYNWLTDEPVGGNR